MKPERLFLILSTIGILFLFILLNFQKPTLTGKISSIKISEDRIDISLENYSGNIIFFNKTKININKSNIIKVYGQEQISLNLKTIFADKVVKIK